METEITCLAVNTTINPDDNFPNTDYTKLEIVTILYENASDFKQLLETTKLDKVSSIYFK